MPKQSPTVTASCRIYERRQQTFEATLFGFFMCFLLSRILLVAGNCPIELHPKTVVVSYGSSVSVDCSTNITYKSFGWEVSEGKWSMTRKSLITWKVSNLTQWDIEPLCYINYDTQCEKYLPVTVYKTPDIVSISTVNHTGPVTEGSMLILQCDIINVAPVHNLTVRWYKGETLMNYKTFSDTIKTPVNITDSLQITPDRDDDGSQYRCEAVLQLGEEGPQPPPTVTSEALHITVHYSPVINETKLPSIVPVFQGYSEVLVCEAEGNPKPTVKWRYPNGTVISGGNLPITEATIGHGGFYYCTAENSVNNTTRQVQVVVQENYVPIILGIVVAIVVVISIIIVYIYMTYYQKTKMGQYILRKANPQSRNGQIGQAAQAP